MREKKYHLYLTADEQSKVIQSLIDLKNNLIAQGRCENGIVYTVEGNSGDACRQRQYTVGSSSIYGYGVPAY